MNHDESEKVYLFNVFESITTEELNDLNKSANVYEVEMNEGRFNYHYGIL